MNMAELPLARGFPAADERAWRTLVEQALKGAPFSSLESKTSDGIAVEPLYGRAENAQVIPGRAPGTPWEVIQRIEIAHDETANRQILDDLNNGANGFALVCQGSVGDYGHAMPPSEALLKGAMDGVQLDAGIVLDLQLGPLCKDAALMIANFVHMKGVSPSEVNIRFGFDPIGVIAANGWDNVAWPDMSHVFAQLVREMQTQGFKGPFAVGDGRVIHAAGGSEAQELAFTIASALAYVRAAHEGGIPLDEARRVVFFRLAADQNQLLTTAKFRALRKLWSRVEEACGLEPKPAFVTAETAWRMMTKRDPHGNIVRGTIAALAAAVGGANAITVLPFSAAVGLPDHFARRVARNTQTILLEEANLYRVADPAAGSGAIEALTDALCLTAWKLFQKIEETGGPAEALHAGLIQREIAATRADREAAAAKRKDPLIGTSEFPDIAETSVAVLDIEPSVVDEPEDAITLEPLQSIRIAEPFEALRDQSDTHLAERGERPKVFLACLGRPADFNARAAFAKSLFEAGGITAIAPETAQSQDEMLKAFKVSGAKLACLCSSDRVYEAEGAEAAKALAAAGAKHIYLAGKPNDAIKSAGVRSFVSTGTDALSVLREAYANLGA